MSDHSYTEIDIKISRNGGSAHISGVDVRPLFVAMDEFAETIPEDGPPAGSVMIAALGSRVAMAAWEGDVDLAKSGHEGTPTLDSIIDLIRTTYHACAGPKN